MTLKKAWWYAGLAGLCGFVLFDLVTLGPGQRVSLLTFFSVFLGPVAAFSAFEHPIHDVVVFLVVAGFILALIGALVS